MTCMGIPVNKMTAFAPTTTAKANQPHGEARTYAPCSAGLQAKMTGRHLKCVDAACRWMLGSAAGPAVLQLLGLLLLPESPRYTEFS